MVERVELFDELDVMVARQCARNMARELGFGLTDQTRIATAVSEVARLALDKSAIFFFAVVTKGARQGLECACEWTRHFSDYTPKTFEGVQRLMDDFLEMKAGEKTVLVMRRWLV